MCGKCIYFFTFQAGVSGEDQATNPRMISTQDVISADGNGDGVELQID